MSKNKSSAELSQIYDQQINFLIENLMSNLLPKEIEEDWFDVEPKPKSKPKLIINNFVKKYNQKYNKYFNFKNK